MPEVTIHKHWIGAAAIGLAGGLVIAGLIFVSFTFSATNPIQWIIGFITLVTAIYTLVALWVYNANKIVLNDSGVTYYKVSGLFHSITPTTDWNTIESISVQQGGIFAKIFNYGRLFVQTADANANFGMTMTPTPHTWQQYIDKHADVSKAGDAA